MALTIKQLNEKLQAYDEAELFPGVAKENYSKEELINDLHDLTKTIQSKVMSLDNANIDISDPIKCIFNAANEIIIKIQKFNG